MTDSVWRDENGETGPDGYTDATRPDWDGRCSNCDQSPVVPAVGLCGPCCFGEAETAVGNW